MWVPLTHEYVSEVAYDTEHFTSRGVVVSRGDDGRLPEAPIGGAPPITSDPPFHHHARRILLPPFSPEGDRALGARDPRPVRRPRRGDRRPRRRDVVDASLQYAQHIPVNVIARMLGLPLEDDDLFREFVHDALEAVDVPDRRAHRLQRRARRLPRRAHRRARRRTGRRPDLLPARRRAVRRTAQPRARARLRRAAAARRDRHDVERDRLEPLAPRHPSRRPPPTRRRARADPDRHRGAAAGLRPGDDGPLRRQGPRLPRLPDEGAASGCCCRSRRPTATRTPFDRPDEVVIDRLENRHAAFGLGIHRCLGSNLARLELRVAIEEFLARIPEFELADPTGERSCGASVRSAARASSRCASSDACGQSRMRTDPGGGGAASVVDDLVGLAVDALLAPSS